MYVPSAGTVTLVTVGIVRSFSVSVVFCPADIGLFAMSYIDAPSAGSILTVSTPLGVPVIFSTTLTMLSPPVRAPSLLFVILDIVAFVAEPPFCVNTRFKSPESSAVPPV